MKVHVNEFMKVNVFIALLHFQTEIGLIKSNLALITSQH